jgi:hypothetical protein
MSPWKLPAPQLQGDAERGPLPTSQSLLDATTPDAAWNAAFTLLSHRVLQGELSPLLQILQAIMPRWGVSPAPLVLPSFARGVKVWHDRLSEQDPQQLTTPLHLIASLLQPDATSALRNAEALWECARAL